MIPESSKAWGSVHEIVLPDVPRGTLSVISWGHWATGPCASVGVNISTKRVICS